jgi:hypothetical protein
MRADPQRMAWAAARAMFAFALLDRRALARASLPAYFATTGFYAECVLPALALAPDAFADALVESLVAAGAARVRDDHVETTSAA